MAKGVPRPSVDASELLQANAKCVDKSSSEELAAGAITGGEQGCKKVSDDSVGSAGCKKNAHMGRPSDHAVVDGHSLVSFCGQKVLPLELILSSGSHPARVSKPTSNTEVRLLSNNVTQDYTGSSMSKEVKEEEAAEGGHKSKSKALDQTQLALASPDSSREPDQLVSLMKRRKLKKKERSAISRHDVAWLLSRLKGHRRVRSVGQRQRSRVLARVAEVSNASAASERLMPVVGAGHPSLVEATCNEAAANLSLEEIKDIAPNEGSDACRNVQEKEKKKKKKKKIIKKKVAKIDIDRMETHASTSTNGEKIKGSTKKKAKMVDEQPARQVVAELEIKALKKRKREAKEQADVAVLERCKRRDGREWQCREPVVKVGATYCEYHTLKVKENHARSAEKLEAPQVGLSNKKRRRDSMDGAECGAEEDHEAVEKSGGKVVVQVVRRRWRKKCKPCIRRLHEIQERALAAGTELREGEGEEETRSSPSRAPSPEETHIQLPECLLNTDPREWRPDFLLL